MKATSPRKIGSPPYATIPMGSDITGIGRTKLYDLAGDGTLRMVKVGSRTLLDVTHALAYLDGLPAAELTPRFRKAA